MHRPVFDVMPGFTVGYRPLIDETRPVDGCFTRFSFQPLSVPDTCIGADLVLVVMVWDELYEGWRWATAGPEFRERVSAEKRRGFINTNTWYNAVLVRESVYQRMWGYGPAGMPVLTLLEETFVTAADALRLQAQVIGPVQERVGALSFGRTFHDSVVVRLGDSPTAPSMVLKNAALAAFLEGLRRIAVGAPLFGEGDA